MNMLSSLLVHVYGSLSCEFSPWKGMAGYEIFDCRRRRRPSGKPSVPELKEGSELRVLITERWVSSWSKVDYMELLSGWQIWIIA
jgi:hypothetical protein